MAYIDVQSAGDDPSPPPAPVDRSAGSEKAHSVQKAHTVDSDLEGRLANLILNERDQTRRRGDRNIMQGYHAIPTFAAALRLVAHSVAKVDWGAKRDGDPVDEHTFLDVWSRPSSVHSGYVFRYIWQVHLELFGECFALIEEGDADRPVLTLIPPTDIRRSRQSEGWEVRHGNLQEDVPEEDVLHIMEPNPEEPYGRGVGLGRVLANELEIDEAAAKHEMLEFRNNAVPDFLMYVPGADEEETDRFKQKWRGKHRGPENFGSGAFIGGPPETAPQLEVVSRKLADMNVKELRDFTQNVIRKTFGVPPELLGDVRDSNRNTITNAQSIFAENVLMRRLEFLRDQLQHKLLPRFEDAEDVKLTFADPRPESKQRKLELLDKAPWALTRNEARDLVDLPPVEDGQQYAVPTNVEMADAADVEGEAPDGGTRTKAPDSEGRDTMADTSDKIIRVTGWSKQEPNPDLTPEQIAERLTPEFIEAEWADPYEDEVQQWVERTQQELGIRPDFTVVNPMIREHVQEFGAERVKDINDTTRQQIRDTLEEGIDQGLGSQEIAGKLDDFYTGQVLGSRAEAIARTEMGRAAGWATDQAHKASGVVDRQEWIATMDSRVRPEHAAMDGQITPIDEPFEAPSGATAKDVCPVCQYPLQKFPGGFGVARLDIMCRCTLAAVINQRDFQRLIEKGATPGYIKGTPARVVVDNGDGTFDKPDTTEAMWKAFDEALEASEQRFLAVVRDGLRKQKTEQLDPALEEAFDLSDAA